MKRSIFKIQVLALIVASVSLAAMPVRAQDAQQPDFPILPAALEKQLAARASDVNEVTLNKNMLKFAGQFMEKDDQEAKGLIQKLNAIYVRTYKFNQSGAYTLEDLKTIRKLFLGPDWNPMVRERSLKSGDNTDVYVKDVNGQIHGMFVLTAEPKELSLVYISGTIDPHDLGELSGNFGIPKVGTDAHSTKPSRESAK